MQEKSIERITILVEGATDQAIVQHLLTALGGVTPYLTEIEVCGGKQGVRDRYHVTRHFRKKVIALVDSDEPSVPDAENWARRFFGTEDATVFCAVPTIEAWLFADKDLAKKHARPIKSSESIFGRMVTPESLMDPKGLTKKLFSPSVIKSKFEFLKDVNIGEAVASSTSMFRFLRGVELAIGNDWPFSERALSNSLNRKVFANLLREIPGKTVGWKTLDGEYTAEQLGDLVLKGDELGLRYVTELLRLARDILAARATPEDELDRDA